MGWRKRKQGGPRRAEGLGGGGGVCNEESGSCPGETRQPPSLPPSLLPSPHLKVSFVQAHILPKQVLERGRDVVDEVVAEHQEGGCQEYDPSKGRGGLLLDYRRRHAF